MRVDPELVRSLHRDVGDRLQREQVTRRNRGDRPLTGPAEQQTARKLIADAIREHAEQLMSRGMPTLDVDAEQELAEGVHARMFGAGRLQVLLNDDAIENIDINGCDEVWVTRAGGGGPQLADPVAATDEELVELVQTLASYAGLSSRPWDAANPFLDLRLPDGSRLSAVQRLSARPAVSVRRHRLPKATLGDLVGNGTLSEDAAEFLTAAVKARHNIMIAGATDAGKALAVDTPIPTPYGWTTMGHLNAGDRIFDDQGRPCTVTHVHPVRTGRPCFEVEFATGDVIVADADHLWEVSSRRDRARQKHWTPGPGLKPVERDLEHLLGLALEESDRDVTVNELIEEAGEHWAISLQRLARKLEPVAAKLVAFPRSDRRPGASQVTRRPVATYSRQRLLKELVSARIKPRVMPRISQVRSTGELAREMTVAQPNGHVYNNWQVRIAAPLEYPEKDLPIDPYVLGVWLGDGSTSTARISTADEWVLGEFDRLGYPTHRVHRNDPYTYAVGGSLQTKLNVLGVLGDKHIPRDYLQGSVEQRRALLQGLLDSDGTTSKSGSVEFAVTLRILAQQFHELVSGLGYAAHLSTKAVKFRGEDCGRCWIVRWTTEESVFRMPRKHQMHDDRTRRGPQVQARRRSRTIVEIRPTASVPVRCITVDSPSELYLAGHACIPTHNTTLLRALASEVGPEERIVTVEKALELGLRSDTARHPNCVELEEGTANSEGHGAVDMAELVRRTLRMNPARVIVGEVLGDEVITMLNAMGQGNNGSLSTIHARAARDVFNRIATYAIQGSERLPHEASYQLIAGGLDFVVYISQELGTGRRRLTTVLEVNGFDDGVMASEIFKAGPGGDAAWTGAMPARGDQLAVAGWTPAAGEW